MPSGFNPTVTVVTSAFVASFITETLPFCKLEKTP